MRNVIKPRTLAIVLGLALLSLTSLSAQVVSGSVSGLVTDAQGAAIPGAKVTLIDQVQTTTRTVSTSAEGTFNFTPVLASTYMLVIEGGGFVLEVWGVQNRLGHGVSSYGRNTRSGGLVCQV